MSHGLQGMRLHLQELVLRFINFGKLLEEVFRELSSPPQAENFQDLNIILYRKYTIHYTENTRVTVRAETAFNGTCSPETAQVSRLRRAVYGKPFRLWEWDFPLMGMQNSSKSPYGKLFRRTTHHP